MGEMLLITTLVIWGFVTVWFGVSLLLKRNDVADVAWGLGIVVVTITGLLLGERDATSILVTTLVIVWGLRLGIHIGMRNSKKGEDPRYAQWRRDWGKWFVVRSYAQVFLLQGVLMIVVGYPALHAAMYGTHLTLLAYLGVAVWAFGFFFESVGDYQLMRFISKPENKGKIMKYGLWRFTRHPNYFGEVTQWWGIFLIVAGLPYGLVSIISPIAITFLILKVSGIPMLEKQFEGNVEFEEYKKRTSAFFPFPPRRT